MPVCEILHLAVLSFLVSLIRGWWKGVWIHPLLQVFFTVCGCELWERGSYRSVLRWGGTVWMGEDGEGGALLVLNALLLRVTMLPIS